MNLLLLRRIILGMALLCASGLFAFAQGTALGTQLDAVVRLSSNVLVGLTPTGALVRSVDNGTTFTQVRATDIVTPPATRALLTLAASNSVLIAAGDAGGFVRSTDGGVTWSTLKYMTSPSFVGSIQGLAGNGNTTWVAVGVNNTKLTPLYSTDSGVTWHLSPTIASPTGKLRSVVWSGQYWVAAGGNSGGGFVLRTTNPSTAWSLATVPSLDPFLYPQTQIAPLSAVASNGSGLVLAVGEAGTLIYSADHGATFSDAGSGYVSDNLRAALFVSGTQWAAAGDLGVVVTFDSTVPGTVTVRQTPSPASETISGLVSGSTAGTYLVATLSLTSTAPQAITASISVVSNQLRVELGGAVSGSSYFVEQSSDLVTWSAASGSTKTYGGVTALFWDFALPGGGSKSLYRIKLGSTP
jgi:hypothetical protein